jgi:hypothetical protein
MTLDPETYLIVEPNNCIEELNPFWTRCVEDFELAEQVTAVELCGRVYKLYIKALFAVCLIGWSSLNCLKFQLFVD